MKYFFILGSNPTLSLAEICSLFPKEQKGNFLPDAVVLETGGLDAKNLINRMGGTIKIGQILFTADNLDFDNLLENLKPYLSPKESGKFNFGISFYGKKNIKIQPLAMKIKSFLRDENINSRWVVSKEKILSSVVAEQNKLTYGGIEIIIIAKDGKILVGKTLAVQPFKDLSFRDYGRPGRDDRSGMLPPKLAQIMINLSANNPAPSPYKEEEQAKVLSKIILDPFCGSGTILTEAILLGYKNLIGSDNSQRAVNDTQKNIEWIEEKFAIQGAKTRIFLSGAQSIAQKIKANSIDAIITEPYLGPQRGNVNEMKIKNELEKLYSEAIRQFIKVLKNNGIVVMIWPVLKNVKQDIYLNPEINGLKIFSPFSSELKEGLALTNRGTIIYGRPGQKVWREIVIMKKGSV